MALTESTNLHLITENRSIVSCDVGASKRRSLFVEVAGLSCQWALQENRMQELVVHFLLKPREWKGVGKPSHNSPAVIDFIWRIFSQLAQMDI